MSDGPFGGIVLTGEINHLEGKTLVWDKPYYSFHMPVDTDRIGLVRPLAKKNQQDRFWSKRIDLCWTRGIIMGGNMIDFWVPFDVVSPAEWAVKTLLNKYESLVRWREEQEGGL